MVRTAWLFLARPALPERVAGGWRAMETRIDERRAEAVSALWQGPDPWGTLARLVQAVDALAAVSQGSIRPPPSGSGVSGVLSIGAGLPGGPQALANQWKIAEEAAARHGKTMDRRHWRLVVNVHVADDDEQALREVNRGERHETVTYFEDTLGRPPGRADDPLRDGVRMGTTLVGTPDTVIRGIERLQELSGGGFGGVLFRAHEWANREQTLKSYELFARYVMPRFQGSLDAPRGSNEWARGNRKTIFSPNVEAVRRAYTDAGREVPAEFRQRTSGARDV